MRKISKISFLLLILFPFALSAQEVLEGLQGNAVAEEYYSKPQHSKKSEVIADTIELPFIDDFSDSDVAPKSSLWSDNYAFVNSSYPVFPPTVGVATLDALNFDGSHYPNAGSKPYQADFLSSQPINLSYPASDSIYLSFYFQPGGLAEPPETSDSLILDFYSPDSLTWIKKWSMPGNGSSAAFKRVMIKIEDSVFLKKGFRFRFRNYASQLAIPDQFDKRANVDLWHIDYVQLDKNRFAADTVLRDVAFIEPLKSILKDYTALPWPHFEAAKNTQRAPYISVLIQNHDSISRNLGKSLEIKDLLRSNPLYKLTPLYNIIASGDTITYKYAYNYPFDFATVKAEAFEIKTILHTEPFDYKPNDTLRRVQKFYDYYALDDGTAEASYGLRGSGTKDASCALKFNAFTGDSLRAIDLYFVQVVDSMNLDDYFYLNVWTDNAGKPGEKIVNQIGSHPEYTGKLNKFARYYLETPVYINGPFYIGFTQTVDKLINLGFDLNTPNQSKNFYNSNNGLWTNSSLPGTTMMHPVFSQSVLTNASTLKAEKMFNVWPNPADDIIHISLNESYTQMSGVKVELIDISGRLIQFVNPEKESEIYTGSLQNGMYFLRLNNSVAGSNNTIKIIINH